MNAIIVSAFLGVVMMFASWSIKGENKQKNIALFGLIFLILANLAQMNGWFVAEVETNVYQYLILLPHLYLYLDQWGRDFKNWKSCG